MEGGTKAFLIVSCAVVMSIVGWVVIGLLGAVLGFIVTLLLFGLFHIWIKYRDSE